MAGKLTETVIDEYNLWLFRVGWVGSDKDVAWMRIAVALLIGATQDQTNTDEGCKQMSAKRERQVIYPQRKPKAQTEQRPKE